MRWLRFILIPILSVVSIAAVIAAHYYYLGFSHSSSNSVKHIRDSEILKLNEKALLLKKFASQKKCNQKIIFLVDMSMPSGKNRFFVYDTEKDSVIKA
ncbi:MAG TPA: hypothetical protein VHZ50_05180, partial [Puia sp.]|nr:hypothetical protein [Puia sp.]